MKKISIIIGSIAGTISALYVICGFIWNIILLPNIVEKQKEALVPVIEKQQEIIDKTEYFTILFQHTIPDSIRNKAAKEFYELKGKKQP